MTDHIPNLGGAAGGEQIVRRPRATDPVGRALRGVFAPVAMPTDWKRLLDELDEPQTN